MTIVLLPFTLQMLPFHALPCWATTSHCCATRLLYWATTFQSNLASPASGGAVPAVLADYCANCVETPAMGGPIYRFGASQPCGPAGWLALLFIKADNVRQIQVRQPHTNESGFPISATNKYTVGSRYR